MLKFDWLKHKVITKKDIQVYTINYNNITELKLIQISKTLICTIIHLSLSLSLSLSITIKCSSVTYTTTSTVTNRHVIIKLTEYSFFQLSHHSLNTTVISLASGSSLGMTVSDEMVCQ